MSANKDQDETSSLLLISKKEIAVAATGRQKENKEVPSVLYYLR